ncbi:MAG: tRNA (N6-threonylcarbamoyladenosine(37)-N6)-methyltransferase TrmO [Pseudomonadales bacterium]|nr:tRNA (N6-threonylcarbamoyladenosine(37)-N6)-methyltransferase TrmO [Pseudomonadales bacterium]
MSHTDLQKTEFAVIGIVESGFKEKFGVPRQPRLTHIRSKIRMLPPFNTPDAFEGLEQFSHIWLSFVFHQTQNTHWRPKVRPPRLGGNRKMGVFATRSTVRPNPLGLSAVRLIAIETLDSGVTLVVEGADLMDNTPIIDIKPYLPFSDQIPDATGGFAENAPEAKLKVVFSSTAQDYLLSLGKQEITDTIIEVLSLDPRPAYHSDPERQYGIHLFDFNVQWRCAENVAIVEKISPVNHEI